MRGGVVFVVQTFDYRLIWCRCKGDLFNASPIIIYHLSKMNHYFESRTVFEGFYIHIYLYIFIYLLCIQKFSRHQTRVQNARWYQCQILLLSANYFVRFISDCGVLVEIKVQSINTFKCCSGRWRWPAIVHALSDLDLLQYSLCNWTGF